MQAIVTKFLAPGNVRGPRVKATANAGSTILRWAGYDHDDDNHIAAARALATKLEWFGEWTMGHLPDGSRVFVHSDKVKTGFTLAKKES